MTTSVVGCLSDLQALWLDSWERNNATASETGHAHFVTHRSRHRAVLMAWPAHSPSCLIWQCPCCTAVEMAVLSSPCLMHKGSCPCLACDRCLHFGICSDRRREVLHSPHKRKNLGASLPEQFIYSSHSSSLHKVPLGRKWQDKSFVLNYSEWTCELWINHAIAMRE